MTGVVVDQFLYRVLFGFANFIACCQIVLLQYVGVASALKDGMTLGGNLPDSLEQYLYYGHDDGIDEFDEDMDDFKERTKTEAISAKGSE